MTIEIPLAMIAGWLISAAAVATALGVISRLRPVKWLMRTLVASPLRAWFSELVGEVVDAQLNARPLTNGWGTQAVKAIAEQVGADVPDIQHHDNPGSFT